MGVLCVSDARYTRRVVSINSVPATPEGLELGTWWWDRVRCPPRGRRQVGAISKGLRQGSQRCCTHVDDALVGIEAQYHGHDCVSGVGNLDRHIVMYSFFITDLCHGLRSTACVIYIIYIYIYMYTHTSTYKWDSGPGALRWTPLPHGRFEASNHVKIMPSHVKSCQNHAKSWQIISNLDDSCLKIPKSS